MIRVPSHTSIVLTRISLTHQHIISHTPPHELGRSQVLTVPEGEMVDALVTREALQHGQTIAEYAVEMQRDVFAEPDGDNAPVNTPWVSVKGVHGLTVGSMVVDVIKPIRGPARVRWRCTAALPTNRYV